MTSMLPRCVFVTIRAAHQQSTRARCLAIVGVNNQAAPQGHCWHCEGAPMPVGPCPHLRHCHSEARFLSARLARGLRSRPSGDDGSGMRCVSGGIRRFHAAPSRPAGAALPRASPAEAPQLLQDVAQSQHSTADAGTAVCSASPHGSVLDEEAGQQAGQQEEPVGQQPALLHEHLWSAQHAEDVRLNADGNDPAENDELRPRQARTRWLCFLMHAAFPVACVGSLSLGMCMPWYVLLET